MTRSGLGLRFVLMVALALLVAAPAFADGDIEVTDAVSRPSRGAPVGVVYLRIANRGDEADRLVSVATEVAKSAQIHETVHEGGVAKMRHRKTVEIPAGGELVLEPGGLHVMLMGLRAPLEAGQEIEVRLGFERSGERVVAVAVRAVKP